MAWYSIGIEEILWCIHHFAWIFVNKKAVYKVGSCVCSQLIKNNNAVTIQSIVCNCFNATKRSFCVNVTLNETWIHHFTQESKWQSAEWTAAGESRPKRSKMQTTAGKVLASVFRDAQSILFIDYLEKGRTINTKYYTALFLRLKEEITRRQQQIKKKKMLFHQDNAPCHKSIATTAKLHELPFELLLYPPYAPDLAPSDCWLFVDLKRMLPRKRFGSNEEVVLETEASNC